MWMRWAELPPRCGASGTSSVDPERLEQSKLGRSKAICDLVYRVRIACAAKTLHVTDGRAHGRAIAAMHRLWGREGEKVLRSLPVFVRRVCISLTHTPHDGVALRGARASAAPPLSECAADAV